MDNTRELGHKSKAAQPVMKEFEREVYDLSHWSFKTGAIGSLMPLSIIPVCAGSSIELDANVVFRMSPLRRNLYIDSVVDLFAFYIPHRHIYGSNWVDFIKAGSDEGVTLGTDTLATDASSEVLLGVTFVQAIPRWLSRGLVQIWNNYFRDPSDVAGILPDNYFTTLAAGSSILEYGLACANLKRMWNSAILSTLTSGDYSLPLSGGEVNLYELAALKGRLRTETARDFFAARYRDVLDYSWSSKVNIDADQRPELIMRSTQWMSGYDVDGTAEGNLGTYAGKSQALCKLSFPSKFMPEHGTIWVCALVRVPPIYYSEVPYLVNKAEPTYAQIAGDPDIVSRTNPPSLLASDVFFANSSTDLGKIPHSQWYREHPSTVAGDYISSAGHPFLEPGSVSARNDLVYIPNTRYDGMFESLMLKHWNSQGHISVQSKCFVPPSEASIFAGSL